MNNPLSSEYGWSSCDDNETPVSYFATSLKWAENNLDSVVKTHNTPYWVEYYATQVVDYSREVSRRINRSDYNIAC